MGSNVLPSAPPEDSHLYPQLQPDFRMQKANEISADLNKEVGHYRKVAKNTNVPKRLSTGALVAQVLLRRCFQARVLQPLFLLLACRLQYRLAVSAGALLLLLQG